MRLLITFLVVCLAVACTARPQEGDYEYEDEVAAPAPPVTPAPTKPPGRVALPNSRQARGPSPLLSRGAKTTAAPPPPKVQEPEVLNEPEDIEDEDLGEEAEAPAVTTTTVAPKKPLAPIVRPFRSNQDLLAALKRRRQQEQQGGSVATHSPSTTTTPSTPAEAKPARSNSNNNSNNGRRTFNRANKTPAPVQEVTSEVEVTNKKPAAALASSSFNRRFSSRGKTTAAPSTSADEVEEEVEEQPAPRAAKSYRGSKRV